MTTAFQFELSVPVSPSATAPAKRLKGNAGAVAALCERRSQRTSTTPSQRLGPTRGSTAQPRSSALRSYFRNLRAAEMAAWNATGGDYVLASFVPANAK